MSKFLGFFKVDERGTTIWKNKKQIEDFIKKLPKGEYLIQISDYKENRSINQNKYYWKLIEFIANEIGYESEELHEVFKYKYLQKTIEDKNGNLVKGLGSTSKLNINEFSAYIEKIKNYVENNLDIKLPD
jgi:DNA-directed RNA polymerase beta' subunit